MQDQVTMPPQDIRRTSDLLRELVLENPALNVTLGELLQALDERAFGFMMFLLAFPVCLPMPPGFSSIMGFLIFPIAFQFLLGRRRPNLPTSIRERPIDRAALAKAIRIIMPSLLWLEKIFRPRWHYVTHGAGEKITGLIILILILVLITPLPPPLHFLPASGIALMALGIMERDGAIVIAGAVVGIGGLTAVGVMGKIIFRWVRHLNAIVAH